MIHAIAWGPLVIVGIAVGAGRRRVPAWLQLATLGWAAVVSFVAGWL